MRPPRRVPVSKGQVAQLPVRPEAEAQAKPILGPRLLCCYPAAPLLKKFDNSGNYTMAGDLACRSELFMKVELIGSLSAKVPYAFSRVGNVYQCVLCGAMYRLMQDNTVLMLMREKWVRVEPDKGLIYLPDGSIKTVLLQVSDMDEVSSKQYIDQERSATDLKHGVKRNEPYSEFNL